MPPLKINNGDIYDELEKDIEATSNQVKDLLKEIQDGHVSFAELKLHLKLLSEVVTELASILRDGKGGQSLLTRVALIEQKIEVSNKGLDKIEKMLEKHISEEDHDRELEKAARNTGKWQLRAALTTGSFGLLAAIVALISHYIK